MHLDRRACQDYYCSQLQNGGSYFQGVSHQRGYGMFSNLFRMISPIAMKAGKYLGKHILSTGSKVMSDVVSGTSLKDSTRARLKETSKNIKDDILHKLQSGSGVGESYLDLAHTLLHLQVKITKKNGSNIATPDVVAPVNYLLNTLFSECSITLNDKQVSSQANYAYRCMFDALLSPKAVQESLLTAGLFFRDSPGKIDATEILNAGEGFKTRYNICKDSKLMDMIGALHFDLGNQSKYLINSVNLRIKLERNKDAFALMSASQDFKIVIQHASLFVRKVKVAPSILIAHETALSRGAIKMPLRRTEVKSFALSSGMQSITIPNAFIGQVPARLIMGMVSNTAYNGDFYNNPFNFKHYDLSYLCLLDGNRMIPSKPYQPKFDTSNSYSRCYMSLFTDLGRYHKDQDINISYSEYKDGYTLLAIDLTPDLSADGMHDSVLRNSNLALDIRFSKALPETVNLIVYAEYRNAIEIDKNRNVLTDF
ncbi:uncharacterized protein F54H12.2 [Trichonephila clavata]|uniref:Uncharacterized protein F54H12.2 n=1 Tax=Trichonephila clavata TaxID=2740835 RepID=A0A8X6FMM4_TRICU|nr:uncharacterized protein F54H12.2 [Trichonephila clavata]